MEVKINKEIRNYTESVYFGLSLRQFIFSVLSIIITIIIYFLFKNNLGIEMTSWLCIIFAAPLILIGFVTYNGMKLEELIFVYLTNKILTPNKLIFNTTNFYEELLQSKEAKKNEIKTKK